MSKELVTTEIIVGDNIKNYFYLYFFCIKKKKQPLFMKRIKIIENNFCLDSKWLTDFVPKGTIGNSDFKTRTVFKDKYNYFLTEQQPKLDKYNLRVKEIYHLLKKLVRKKDIPSKYMPVIEEIKNPFKSGAKNKDHLLFRINIRESIISLLEQKFIGDNSIQNIVHLFKSLAEKDQGKDFDQYIDDWATRLLKETK